MMNLDNKASIAIVSDSGAHFVHPMAHRDGFTLVPNRITISERGFREGVDLDAEESLRLLRRFPHDNAVVTSAINAPTTADYLAIYERLARSGADIVSIHTSRLLSDSWANARAAAQQLSGHCKIAVIDSKTISTAQAMLVSLALQLVKAGDTHADIVRAVRNAVERVYAVYYTETIDMLLHNQYINPSHGMIGILLKVKPFITIENGELIVMEKVMSRIQAVERLIEYATEFTADETVSHEIVIVQHKLPHTESSRTLHDRLAVEFPNHTFPVALYGASLAARIGSDATGLVIMEHPLDRSENGMAKHDDDE